MSVANFTDFWLGGGRDHNPDKFEERQLMEWGHSRKADLANDLDLPQAEDNFRLHILELESGGKPVLEIRLP